MGGQGRNGALRNRRLIGIAAGAALFVGVGGTALTAGAGGISRPNVGPSASVAQVFVGQTADRALDTRQAGGTPFGADETRTLNLSSKVPAEATSVVLNLTLDGSTGPSFITVYPTGETRPNSSANNTQVGEIVPNEFIAKLGTNRSVNIYNERNSTDIVVDVVGYYAPLSSVTGLASGPVFVGSDAPTGAPAAVLTTTAPATVATFTAPAAGSYALTGSVGITFVNTLGGGTPLGAGLIATVDCAWDDGNGVTRGASITSGVTLPGPVTIPGVDTANITVLGSGIDLAAGETVDLECAREQAVSVNDQVAVDVAYSAIQVTA